MLIHKALSHVKFYNFFWQVLQAFRSVSPCTSAFVFILTPLHNYTQIWLQAVLRNVFQPHHWDTLVRRNRLCTNPPKQPLRTENREVSFTSVNAGVSDLAVSGSESVPVCSGRILLCTGLYRNDSLGPRPPTTSLQIQVWMRSTALLPRCFHPRMWIWDASFSPLQGECYV